MTLQHPTEASRHTGFFRGFRADIPAHLEATRQCVSEAIDFIKTFGLEEPLLGEMELAWTEAVTNTVKHVPQPASQDVAGSMEIMVSDAGIESRFEDRNEPYGVKMTEDFPDVDSVGGRGFPIMEMLMDEVEHTELPHGNRLRLFKKIPLAQDALYPELQALERETTSLSEELMSSYESLTAFFKFGALLSESENEDTFREQMLNRLLQITGSSKGVLRLLDSQEGTLKKQWSSNLDDCVEAISLQDPLSPEAKCARDAEDVWTEGMRAVTLKHQTSHQDAHAKDSKIGMVHALRVQSELQGTLWLVRDTAAAYTAAQINMIHTFSEFLAIHRSNVLYQKKMLRIGKMQREMQIAKDIQGSLLPAAHASTDHLEVAGVCQPAREVGGDYFDHMVLSPHAVLLVIADIMGKGIPAALFVAIFRSLLRSQSQLSENPSELAAKVNQLCYNDLNRVGMFLTAQFCYINTEERIMRVANAGHWPLLFIDRKTKASRSISPDGLPIGVDVDFPFEQVEVALPESFNLAMYTDGIPEAIDTDGTPFGAEGMERWIRGTAEGNASPVEDIQSLIQLATQNSQTDQGRDDLSVLMVKTK